MANAVVFEHVSKRYPRGGDTEEGPRYASLRHDLGNVFRRSREGRGGHGKLALDDVSFGIEEGGSVALIGPNGAGKSTALKLVSRISYPTSGRIRLRGRVASLMEVGSGVHPELTGRENIWLYGQLLGMSKADIRRRFDDIVEFSELPHALDTPVKFFSSGMQLRLGFSIAVHMEPDIFVVDEALAVGDAAFQARCVKRMAELSRSGHTIVFVSHNLVAVETLCSTAVLLARGRVVSVGAVQDVVAGYLREVASDVSPGSPTEVVYGAGLDLLEATLHAADGAARSTFEPDASIEIRLQLRVHSPQPTCWMNIGIADGSRGPLIQFETMREDLPISLEPGEHTLSCVIPSLPLSPRRYDVSVEIRDATGNVPLLPWTDACTLIVDEMASGSGPAAHTIAWLGGPVRVDHRWMVDGDPLLSER